MSAKPLDVFVEKRSITINLTPLPPPIPNSYWATPLLCASEYPFSPFHFRPQLDKLLKAGIRTFIDLTEPNELIPYESRLRSRARAVGIPDSEQLWYYRFPIRDRSIPSEDDEIIPKIMSVLHECELADRKAVVHCRGGIGRTGTIIGCWLVQSGRVPDGDVALQIIKILWKKVAKYKRYPNSPETGPQCEFVRKFGRYCREKAEGSIPSLKAEVAPESDHEIQPKRSGGGFSSFSALNLIEDAGVEEEDFGGLMSTLKAVKTKKEKKKGKKETSVAFEDGPPPGEGSDGEAAAAKGDISAPKGPIQVSADDLADEEWGPVKEKKGKKGKKGKSDTKEVEEPEPEPVVEETSKAPVQVTPDDLADEEWASPKDKKGKKDKKSKGDKKGGGKIEKEESDVEDTPAVAAAPEPQVKEEDDAAGEGSTILSKKEKERLKKEREKAKKKAQAAAKKAATEGDEAEPVAPSPAPAAPATLPTAAEEKEEGEDDEEGAGAEEPPAPTPKKLTGALAVMKAALEQKRLAEEAEKRRLEEERSRIEEEERREAELQQLKEEAKQRKKEKEKAKKEQLRKEGKLLTKKQKEEKAAAEIRKKALLESGVKIEGLQQQSNGSANGTVKKVSYGSRKWKGPVAKEGSVTKEVEKADTEDVAESVAV
ncbi:hypothetical protein Clacol_001964 [Clathrus columnatus]|uniref:Tyrosine specific protein phosphatases domain-containing protein n=1 Tax=Clathrus columnatus TaxID=1419009 RepID=A0AAV5A3C0_9AGAM|nr:hypothetical protein Clacol_001964 [Clathrus columnatus]